ncbi:hypothetical protein [Pseudomonas abietaniphila]|uniref:Integrase catalytic domain-containing protein n=1 Tax=Pseudomonas abietaniphila TaxID=89065 RepID=A0A1G7VH05_9PSED|nr:hypothetical protein [Pseudomonas abietaniphila]SDG58977.1 hypothetical protein SAMN05216605_102498 [Pseudomonas abietaniphila]
MKKLRTIAYDFSELCFVNSEMLDDDIRLQFLSRLKAIELRFSGLSGNLIYEQTGVSNSEQSRLTKRFLSLDPDGEYWGDRALLPGKHLNGYNRKAPFAKKRTGQHGSLSGVLSATLDKYPSVRENFVKQVWSIHTANKGMKFEKGILYAFFKKLLREAGVGDDEWPFNERRGGRRSIEKLIDEILDTNFVHASLTLGTKGETHARLGTGELGLIDANIPFDTIELDAYKVDKFCIINVEPLPGIYVPRVIERFWLLAVVEKVTKGFLACNFVFSSEVRAQDVHDILVDAFLGDWKPIEHLTVENLEYSPGSGMMGYILPETQKTLWSSVSLDNAMAHHAIKVKEKLRNNLGFAINFGQLGHPERRWLIENTFHQIASKIMHRTPSTTGSNPYSGRADKAEEKAEMYEVFVDEARQVLDTWVAAYNITPKMGSNYSKSPAELMYAHFHNKKQRLIYPRANQSAVNKFQLKEDIELRRVRGSVKAGVAPHINFAKARYTNPRLAESTHLLGYEVLIKIDPDDYRYVEAYLADGTSLGILTVLGFWCKTRHSGITRKIIYQAYLDRTFEVSHPDDIVLSYLHHLTKNANKKNNLQFTRMYYELMSKNGELDFETSDIEDSDMPITSIDRNEDSPQGSKGSLAPDDVGSIDEEFRMPVGGTE